MQRRGQYTKEPMPPEEWRPIPGIDGYEASCHGRIRRTLKNGEVHIVKQIENKGRSGNEYVVNVKIGDMYTQRTVLRLVALAFYPGKCDGMIAVHRNGLHADNCAWNIVLMTRSENALRAVSRVPRKVVHKVDKNGETLEIYPSLCAAGRANGMSKTTIRKHCLDQKCWSLPGGVTFRYEEE